MLRVGILALLTVLAVVAVAVLSASKTAEADFHLVQITQVMAGAFGNDDIEFVELRMTDPKPQHCQASGKTGAGLFGCDPLTTAPGARLVFFDASGNQTGEFVFDDNTPIGGFGRSILVGTQEFADTFTIPPDHFMPANVVAGSGRVCYRNVVGAPDEVNDCLAYGAFTGDNGLFGAPAEALPISGTTSLLRVATTFINADDFTLGPAAPRNNKNEIGGLAFTLTGQPTSAATDAAILPAVQVEVLDAVGNRIATAVNSITIAIGTNPTGGVLSGATTVSAVNGVATYGDLKIDQPGVGYTLVASAPTLASVTSVAFDILPCQPGDSNVDGNINALDITTVELIVAGILAKTPCADANVDGSINEADITATEILVATAP